MKQHLIRLAGSKNEPVPGTNIVSDADPDEQISVTVFLRRKQPFDLAAFRASHNAPPARHDFKERYGADPEDAARVTAFANELQLTQTGVNLAERWVRIAGRTSDVARAFGVDFKVYVTSRNQRYRGYAGDIYIPRNLRQIVTAVAGLDVRPILSHLHFLPPMLEKSGAPLFQFRDVAALYKFPMQLTGKNQCIGIIELGGGFTSSDLRTYFGDRRIPMPRIVSIGVNGAANRPRHNLLTDGEPTVDVEVAGSIAPDALIAVYFAPNSNEDLLLAIKRAVHDEIYQPKVISISWGLPEFGWTEQIRNEFTATFEDAAAFRITVLASAGDRGNTDMILPGDQPHVHFPASSPLVISCGGTRLTASGPKITSETVWNDGPFPGRGATGGGVSDVFPLPPYQSSIRVPRSPVGFAGRGVPDVTGNGDPVTGYQAFVSGRTFPVGGTSVVAPMYAGLMALINEARQENGQPPAGFIHDELYRSAVCRDVTSGNNDYSGRFGGLYSACPGWDPASGFGSAIGDKWLKVFAGPQA